MQDDWHRANRHANYFRNFKQESGTFYPRPFRISGWTGTAIARTLNAIPATVSLERR